MILAKGTEGVAAVELSRAPERVTYLIDRVSGPEKRRLCEMGMVEGQELKVVSRARHGRMVVKVGECRMALAREIADHVWVK